MSWYVLVHGARMYIPVCTGIHLSVLVHTSTSMYLYIPVHTCMYWYVPVHTSMYWYDWYVLVHTRMYCYVLVYFTHFYNVIPFLTVCGVCRIPSSLSRHFLTALQKKLTMFPLTTVGMHAPSSSSSATCVPLADGRPRTRRTKLALMTS